jgi:3-dehydrotetronate 4-kinase
MTTLLLGCIADDYTGATDLSSMLVRSGLRVIQCFGVPTRSDQFDNVDAIVIALKTRSIEAKDAIKLSLDALHFLQSVGAQRFFFKYCSTFDSTPRGNIGPVADALAEALSVNQLLFCPSFPENGRTVYCGHLFVNGVPLNESGMKDHPLNPMTDSNLVRMLQAQSQRKVALLPLAARIPSDEVCHYIVDAIVDDDLRNIAELARDHKLLTGGSAIAQHWSKGLLERTAKFAASCSGEASSNFASSSSPQAESSPESSSLQNLQPESGVVLAGSCSKATRAQIAEFAKTYPVFFLDIANSASACEAASLALQWIDEHDVGQPLLVCSGASEEDVIAARETLGEKQAAQLTESVFAAIAKGLTERGVRRIIVAGGETSGAVMNALSIQSVRIGKEIAPGVPWVTTFEPPFLRLALKSGNFGGPRFFYDAMEHRT